MSQSMTLQIRINADGSAAVTGLRSVQGELGRLSGAARSAGGGVDSLLGSLKGLAITAGAALSVSALASSFMAANQQAGMLRASLETVTGSVENASTAWEVLQGFAATTPYSLEQAVSAFIKLKAMGLDPSMAAMRSYGNTASAMGKNINQMVEAVADAATGEFERLKEFGVKAKQSGDTVSLTFQGVTTTIGNNAQAIQKYLLDIGNIQFAGAMERQAKTLGGAISNLKKAWDQFFVKLGDTGLTAGAAAIIGDISSGIASLGDYLSGADGIANDFSATMGAMGSAIATTYGELKTGVWSETTTAIMASVGAVAGWIALSTTLSVAIGAVSTAFGILTAILLANPFTLIIAAIGATAGALYALSDQTIEIGNTTVTVGDAVQGAWQTAADYSQAAWDTFSGFVIDEFNRLPPEVVAVGESIVSNWATSMGLMKSWAADAVNFIANAFQTVGTTIGIVAGEIAMMAQGQGDLNRMMDAIKSGAGKTDFVAEAESRTKAALDASRAAFEARTKAAAEDRLETQLGAVVAGENAKQQRLAADSAKKSAMAHITHAGAVSQGAAAHKGAAGAAKEHDTALKQLISHYLPAKDDAEKLAEGVKTLDAALAAGKISQEEYNEALKNMQRELGPATSALQALIDKYDTEGAKARELAKDREDLNKALADGKITAEQAKAALAGLDKQAATATGGDTWSEMWKNAVKRVDDAVASMWKNLISGTGSTLENMKDMLLTWLAEVAHALLTRPLVVAITTALTGTTGTAGATGATGAASNLGGLSNLWSMGSGLWNGITSLFSGSAYSGIISGFNTAWSAISSQGYFGAAGGLLADAATTTGGLGQAFMMSAPYLLPLAAIAGVVLNKFFADQKPRYGAWSATVGNNPRGLEDWENGADNYSKGGFGLTFGLSDNGSKNMDASEFKDQFDAFAQITQMLADFFGKSLSDKIQAGLESAAFANWTKDGVMRLAANGDMAGAFKGIIDMIADQAAITGEHLGVAFEYALGDLTGTAEEMATQVQVAMQAAAAYTLIADEWNSHMGEMMGLTGDFGADIRILGGYVAAFSNDGENAAQTLARIAAEISALEYAATITTTAIEGLSGTALIQMAEDLADAFGSIDVAAQALAFYGQNFQHAGELFAIQARAAMEQINRIWKDLDFGEAEQIIPATRDEFTALIKGLDLTTESGRELFAELMKLSPMFDTLFDSMDAFVEWLSPADKTKLALDRITGVFEEMGIKLPNTRDELLKLYESGGLTIEQMAVLGSYLDELKLLFGDVGDEVVDLTEKLAAQRLNLLDLAEQLDPTPYGSHDRIMQAEQALRDAGYKGDIFDAKRIAEFIRAIAELEDAGGDAGAKLIKFAKDFEQVFDDIARIASEKVDLNIRLLTLMGKDEEVLALQRQRELDAIDESNRWILKRIYALEDEQRALEKRKDEERKRVEDEYQSRMDAIQAEREALDEAHQAQMEALSKQRDAANEALSAANGLLNSIQSALNSIRGSQPVDEFSRIRAQRQMAAWAASGTLPEQEALDRALGTISRTSANDFASESAYRLSKQTDYANLLVLEGLAGDKVDWAEKTVESLDKQAEMLDDYYQQSLDALDKQSEMISDWRDAQLERIDKLVINSDDILTKLDWLNPGAATGPVMVGANNGGDFQAMRDEIAGLRADLAAIGTAQVTPLKSIDERLRKFDNDGMPPSRDGEVLLRAA